MEEKMKVALFNGSMRPNGNTNFALEEIAKVLNEENIETEILQIGNKPIRDCIACGGCATTGKCVFNDDVANEWIEKMKTADGFVIGSPVYFAHASGRLLSILDRVFYAGKKHFAGKVGASIVVARRAGGTFSQDCINKHLLLSNVIVASSTYWNITYGKEPGEVLKDEEGMQTMRNLARNIAYVLKCLQAGKESGIMPPQLERRN